MSAASREPARNLAYRIARRAARLWLPATLGLLALVTALSLWPQPELQNAVPGNDKSHHLLAYAALAFPATFAGVRRWPLVLAGLAAWGWGIEAVQPLVGRTNDLGDLTANAAGLAAGALAGAALRRLLRRAGGG